MRTQMQTEEAELVWSEHKVTQPSGVASQMIQNPQKTTGNNQLGNTQTSIYQREKANSGQDR